MSDNNINHFTTIDYCGPLEFLVFLCQNSEINLKQVSLLNLIDQAIFKLESLKQDKIEFAADFIDAMSSLLNLKSKLLLPSYSKDDLKPQELLDIEFLKTLIEYGQFKDKAIALSKRFDAEKDHYYRPVQVEIVREKSPISEHADIELLQKLLQQILAKEPFKEEVGTLKREQFKVANSMNKLKKELNMLSALNFKQLVAQCSCNKELVTIFLALLELMKTGWLRVEEVGALDYKIIKN